MEIENIEYVTSLATVYKDGSPSLVISCLAAYSFGEVELQAEEVKSYQLLDGIYDELVMAVKKMKGEKNEWQRFERQSSN